MMKRWNQMLTVSALLGGLLVTLSCAQGLDNLHEDNINDLVDEILIALKEEKAIVSALEPVSFADINHRDFKTSRGKISGLSNLHRHGDCYLIFHDNKTLTLNGHLSAKRITFSMGYKVRPLFLWIDGSMRGGIDMIAVEASLYSDGKTLRVKTLRVSHLDGFAINSVSVMGLSSSSLLKELANTFATKYKEDIVAAIESGMSSFIREAISCHLDGKCKTGKSF